MNQPETDRTDPVRVLQRIQLQRGMLTISALLAVMGLLGLALVRLTGIHPNSDLEELTVAAMAWLAVTGLPLHMDRWGGPWHLALPVAVLSVLGYARLTLGAIGTSIEPGTDRGSRTGLHYRRRGTQPFPAALDCRGRLGRRALGRR